MSLTKLRSGSPRRVTGMRSQESPPLLLTANKPPARLKVKLPDLASRLSWGAVVKVHPPSDAEKIELLQSKARARGFDLPFDVAVYLLQRIPRDTGSLLAMIQRLDRDTTGLLVFSIHKMSSA